MSNYLPKIYLARHGETAWTITGQHTGTTDIPLTAAGEQEAIRLGKHLEGVHSRRVLSSPRERARRTCELAGFGREIEIEADLAEWNYGLYEGRTTSDIRQEAPDWSIFRDGCPEGETAAQVGARADRIIARLHDLDGDTLIFSHGHFLRVLAARWLRLPAQSGALFQLATASVSILSFEHTRSEPVIALWNDN